MSRCYSPILILLFSLTLSAWPDTPKSARPEKAAETFDAAWRIIRDTHYDPKLNGLDWEAVRSELRPRAEAAQTLAELRNVLQEMLKRLGESHFALLPKETVDALDAKEPANKDDKTEENKKKTVKGDLGLEVRLVEGQVLVTRVEPDGPAAKAGVKSGWVVKAVDGHALADVLKALPKKTVNERAVAVMAWSATTERIKGKAGTTARIDFLDGDDQPQSRELSRRNEPGQAVKFGNLPTLTARLQSERVATPASRTAGVIRFNIWMAPLAAEFDQALNELRGCDGVVIDLRGNVGGLGGMIMGTAGHFLTEHKNLGTMRLRGAELRLLANPRRVDAVGNPVEPFAGPLAVLVDVASVSTSELFAGGLQAVGRARVFGQTSLGAALPSALDRLPNGDVLQHVVADFVAPSGKRLEGRGVVPDEAVPLTRADLLAGRDAVRDAALRWIDQAKK